MRKGPFHENQNFTFCASYCSLFHVAKLFHSRDARPQSLAEHEE